MSGFLSVVCIAAIAHATIVEAFCFHSAHHACLRAHLQRSHARRAKTLSMGFFDDIVGAAKENFREVTVQHVLVNSQSEALEIFENIAAEEESDMSALIGKFAVERSTCGSAKKSPTAKLSLLRGQPGELRFRRGSMDPNFEKYAFEATPGTLVRPFRTQFGWHVMLVNS